VQSLPSGARASLVFAVAVAPSREEALYRASYWRDREKPVYAQATAYQNWFEENAPRFDCSDPWLTKLWYHRWAAVRRFRGETDTARRRRRSCRCPGARFRRSRVRAGAVRGGDYALATGDGF
jgi:hypothetical protein